MTKNEMVLTLMKGTIADFPVEKQKQLQDCADKIRTMVKECGDVDLGDCAVALVYAEIQVKEEKGG